MSIGVLSGTLDGETIEVVFESSYSASDTENIANVSGFDVSSGSSSSSIKVLTFDNFQRDGTGRWATHEIIGVDKKPILEFIGPDLETISFLILLSTTLGVTPVDELKKLRKLRDNGVVCTLSLGGNAVTANSWTVQKLSEAHKAYDNNGNLLAASVNVSLTEYVKLPKEE